MVGDELILIHFIYISFQQTNLSQFSQLVNHLKSYRIKIHIDKHHLSLLLRCVADVSVLIDVARNLIQDRHVKHA